MSTPTSSELHAIKNLKQIAREECIAPGTLLCGGCGGLEALRLAAKVLGPKTWYFCYDNESYGNPGMQMSSATPYGARTATTPGSARTRAGTEHGKKDLFEIWRAHRPAYLATVSPRYPVDLTNKFLKAKRCRGPKLFIAHAPCPTGGLYHPERTAEYACLAVETGIFALKEAVDGVVTHTPVPRRRRPVETTCKARGATSTSLSRPVMRRRSSRYKRRLIGIGRKLRTTFCEGAEQTGAWQTLDHTDAPRGLAARQCRGGVSIL